VLPKQALERLRRDDLIFDTFQLSKQRSGVVRIQYDLEAQGYFCNIKTIACANKA
jgi:hypothetical protein